MGPSRLRHFKMMMNGQSGWFESRRHRDGDNWNRSNEANGDSMGAGKGAAPRRVPPKNAQTKEALDATTRRPFVPKSLQGKVDTPGDISDGSLPGPSSILPGDAQQEDLVWEEEEAAHGYDGEPPAKRPRAGEIAD